MHIPDICPAPFLSFRMTNFSWSQFVISWFCGKPHAAPLEVLVDRSGWWISNLLVATVWISSRNFLAGILTSRLCHLLQLQLEMLMMQIFFTEKFMGCDLVMGKRLRYASFYLERPFSEGNVEQLRHTGLSFKVSCWRWDPECWIWAI